jgi:hypothetical protein
MAKSSIHITSVATAPFPCGRLVSYLTTIYPPQMTSSAECYVRFNALGEIERISEVKENGRDLFQFTLSAFI